MAAEAVAEGHRPLEVDAIAFLERREGRSLERFRADIGGHFSTAQADDREANAIDSHAVAVRQIVELRLHGQAHALRDGLHRRDCPHVFDQARKHGGCIA